MQILSLFQKTPIRFSQKKQAPIIQPSAELKQARTLLRDWGASWMEVVKGKHVVADCLAACTIAAVALPLNIALAIACGLPPQAGILAGAIGGGVAAFFGGSSLQVTGPSAALNVMVLSLAHNFGVIGVAASCILIGLMQLVLGGVAAGRLIRFVPEAVLAGFTSGVGLKLLDQQLPELLGFDYSVFELAQMIHRPAWLHEVSWLSVVSGIFVALLVISCKPFKKFPAALMGIALITYVANHLNWNIERVGALSGRLTIPDFSPLSAEKWLTLAVAALPLGLLAAIESLLAAQATDRFSGALRPHNSNLELIGQGLGNIASGLVGGIPVSGAVVRSTINVQSGGKTRLSAILHAVLLLVALFYLSEMIAKIPLGALAGLLCVVGLRLIEVHTALHLLKKNILEAAAFFLAAAGTISGHLMMGLVSGSVLYALQHWVRKSLDSTNAPHSPSAPSVNPKTGIRAVISLQGKEKPRMGHYVPQAESQNWLSQIRERATLAATSFVHQRASIIGKVILGDHVHIAAESSIRADEGAPFYIGSNSNIQDGVVIHALKEKWVQVASEDWAVYIGESVSIAHQALIHGPCYIGANSFVGFQAVVHDSTIGPHCYIGIGAIVVGVNLPEGRYVPHGLVVDTQDKVDALPKVSHAHLDFNEDVVGVNKGLAAAYRKYNRQITPSYLKMSPDFLQGKIRLERF